MNPPVIGQFGHADPNESPLTVNDLIDLLNTLLGIEITGSYIPYVIGNSTPSVDDRDKAWIELDTQGRPTAIKIFYQGNWRRIYNGMLGEIRMFFGDPTITTDWDTNGHGIPGGKYDGWQICNGKNGAPDLSDQFPIGAHMNNAGGHVGYGGSGWQTFVDGTTDLSSGGDANKLITAPYLPPLDLKITGRAAKEAASDGDIEVIVDRRWDSAIPAHVADVGNVYGANPGATPAVPQVNFPTLPPFRAFGFIIFQGYN